MAQDLSINLRERVIAAVGQTSDCRTIKSAKWRFTF
jgi:hypothetical protein